MRRGMDGRCGWVFLAGVLAIYPGKAQQILTCGGDVRLVAPADASNPQDYVTTIAAGVNVAPGAANVRFNLSKQTPSKPGGPTFLVASPSSGVTPATVYITLDPNVVPYLPAGVYGEFVTFTAAQSPSMCSIDVILTLTPTGPPRVTSMVSSATLQPAISPGELVSIFGAGLGAPPVSSHFDPTGLYPTTLGNTIVTFDGVAAPLLYVSNTQINTVVPYEVAGQNSVSVVVTHPASALLSASTFSVPIMDTSPGIFTATETGTGQGVIINASDPNGIVFNSLSNPAPKGSVITFFATGVGLWNQSIQDGIVILGPFRPPIPPAAPISLTIGGQPAQILYAGAEPFQVSGMLQVNAIVPNGIGSGPQPVVVTIGQNSNANQQVTLVVE